MYATASCLAAGKGGHTGSRVASDGHGLWQSIFGSILLGPSIYTVEALHEADKTWKTEIVSDRIRAMQIMRRNK